MSLQTSGIPESLAELIFLFSVSSQKEASREESDVSSNFQFSEYHLHKIKGL